MYRVTVPELFFLREKIHIRQLQQHRMALAIAENPHRKDPAELWKALESIDVVEERESIEPKFDTVGFEILKQQMSQNPRIKVR